jgi:hypothetical protein
MYTSGGRRDRNVKGRSDKDPFLGSPWYAGYIRIILRLPWHVGLMVSRRSTLSSSTYMSKRQCIRTPTTRGRCNDMTHLAERGAYTPLHPPAMSIITAKAAISNILPSPLPNRGNDELAVQLFSAGRIRNGGASFDQSLFTNLSFNHA